MRRGRRCTRFNSIWLCYRNRKISGSLTRESSDSEVLTTSARQYHCDNATTPIGVPIERATHAALTDPKTTRIKKSRLGASLQTRSKSPYELTHEAAFTKRAVNRRACWGVPLVLGPCDGGSAPQRTRNPSQFASSVSSPAAIPADLSMAVVTIARYTTLAEVCLLYLNRASGRRETRVSLASLRPKCLRKS